MTSDQSTQFDIPNGEPTVDLSQSAMSSLDAVIPDNTVLVLYAPRIPGSKIPVVGAHCGVPLRLVEEAPSGRLEVVIDAYLGQEAGDTVSLNMNGQPDIDSTQTKATDDQTTLYVPKGLLWADVVNRLTYTVTRGSQNMGTSNVLEVLHNTVRPGNRDRDAEVGGHSELELLLPDVIKNGVGPDFPVAGALVCVSYPYCRAYDRIWLKCNGFDVYHDVTELEAPAPGSSNPVKVCFTVTRADLEGGGSHPQFYFNFSVIDQLGNFPDPTALWSATKTADVDLSGSRLPKAILREDLSDANDTPETIDRQKLGFKPLNVIIPTRDSRFRVGDVVKVIYTAQSTGRPDVVVLLEGTVSGDELGDPVRLVLTVANDKVVTAESVTVTYRLERNGTPVADSRTAFARVIGEGLPALVKPRVQKTVNGVLHPLDNQQGANGQVEVQGWRQGDTVRLIVKGSAGVGSPVFTAKPLNSNNRANFPLDKAFINANMGREPVVFEYKFIRDSNEHTSLSTTITVAKIKDGDLQLPTPMLDGANHSNNELDVASLPNTAQLRLSEWPLQEKGQCLWVLYEGINADGAAVSFEDSKGEFHDTLPGLVRPAPVSWLKTLKRGSKLTIYVQVNFDGVADKSTATKFPIQTYLIKTITVEKFESTPLQQISVAGQSMFSKIFRITLLSKTQPLQHLSFARPHSSYYGGGVQGVVFYNYDHMTNATMSFSVELISGTANRIRFWIKAANITTTTPRIDVSFLNSTGQVLGGQYFNSPSAFYAGFQIDSGILTNIKSIRFAPNTQFHFDQFEVE